MRAFVMLLLLSFATTCHAEDPLERLNTVEDTLATMEQALQAQAKAKALVLPGAKEQIRIGKYGTGVGTPDRGGSQSDPPQELDRVQRM